MRNTGQAAAIVLATALVAVAPANAHAARLKGQVIAPPYAAKKGTAVLVLLSTKSARRAKLKSRIGELRVISRTMKVAGGGRTATQRLRVNDRFRARARVRRAARRSPYWRVTSRRIKVTQRAGALSPAELQELVEGLRADLTKLSTTVDDLARYTVAQFEAVRAEMASMRADLSALRSEFTALSAQVAAMQSELDAVEAELDALAADVSALAAELDALESQLAGLSADLAALTATVSGLEDLLTGVGPGDLADALSDVATLQAAVSDLQSDVGVLCGPTSPLDALC